MSPILLLSLFIVAALGHEDYHYDPFEEDEDFGHEPAHWEEHEFEHDAKKSHRPDGEHHDEKKDHHEPSVLSPASSYGHKSMPYHARPRGHSRLRSQRARDPRYREGLNDLAGLM